MSFKQPGACWQPVAAVAAPEAGYFDSPLPFFFFYDKQKQGPERATVWKRSGHSKHLPERATLLQLLLGRQAPGAQPQGPSQCPFLCAQYLCFPSLMNSVSSSEHPLYFSVPPRKLVMADVSLQRPLVALSRPGLAPSLVFAPPPSLFT